MLFRSESVIRIEVSAVDPVSESTIDKESLNLRKELQEARVIGVKQSSSGPSPAGARGVDVVELGVLVASIAPTVPVINKILTVLQSCCRTARTGQFE